MLCKTPVTKPCTAMFRLWLSWILDKISILFLANKSTVSCYIVEKINILLIYRKYTEPIHKSPNPKLNVFASQLPLSLIMKMSIHTQKWWRGNTKWRQ